MTWKSGIKPFHNALHNIETSAAHLAFRNNLAESSAAYLAENYPDDYRRLLTAATQSKKQFSNGLIAVDATATNQVFYYSDTETNSDGSAAQRFRKYDRLLTYETGTSFHWLGQSVNIFRQSNSSTPIRFQSNAESYQTLAASASSTFVAGHAINAQGTSVPCLLSWDSTHPNQLIVFDAIPRAYDRLLSLSGFDLVASSGNSLYVITPKAGNYSEQFIYNGGTGFAPGPMCVGFDPQNNEYLYVANNAVSPPQISQFNLSYNRGWSGSFRQNFTLTGMSPIVSIIATQNMGIWALDNVGNIYVISLITNPTSVTGGSSFSNSESGTFVSYTNKTQNFLLSGSPSLSDSLSLRITDSNLPGGSRTVKYGVLSTDTSLVVLAADFASAINADSVLNNGAYGIVARSASSTVTVESISPATTSYLATVQGTSESIQQLQAPNNATTQVILKTTNSNLNSAIASITITDAGIAGGSQSVSYTANSTDTLNSVCNQLANQINAAAAFQNCGIRASVVQSWINITSDSNSNTSYSASGTGVLSTSIQKTLTSSTSPPVFVLSMSGTPVANDTVRIAVSGANLGNRTITYQVKSTDNLAGVAQGLAKAANNDPVLSAYGYSALAIGTHISFQSFDDATYSFSYEQSGPGGETVTIANAGGGAQVTINGSIIPNDAVDISFINSSVPYSAVVTHDVVSTDSWNSIASDLCSKINTNATLIANSVSATVSNNIININIPSAFNGGIVTGSSGGRGILPNGQIVGGCLADGGPNLVVCTVSTGGVAGLTYNGSVLQLLGEASQVFQEFGQTPNANGGEQVAYPTVIDSYATRSPLAETFNKAIYGIYSPGGNNVDVLVYLATGFYDNTEANAQNIQSLTFKQQGYQVYQTFAPTTCTVTLSDNILFVETPTAYTGDAHTTVDPTEIVAISETLTSTVKLSFTELLPAKETTQRNFQLVGGIPKLATVIEHWRSNVLPVHENLKGIQASGRHTSFYDQYAGNGIAYQSVSTGTSFKHSGYQYLLVMPPSGVCAVFGETIIVHEALTPTYKLAYTEKLPIHELLLTLPLTFSDLATLKEAVSYKIVRSFTDLLPAKETFSTNRGFPSTEKGTVSESFSQTVKLSFTEKLLPNDSNWSAVDERPLVAVDNYFTSEIKIRQTVDNYFTTKPQVEIPFTTDSYGIQLPILQNTLVAVTDATSASNPLKPTLVLRGTVVYAASGNPAPTNLTNTSVYFNYKTAGVTNLNLTSMYSFGFTLDYNGGSFNVTSKSPLGGSYYQLVPLNQYNPGLVYPLPIIIDYGSSYPYSQFVYPTGVSLGQYSGANLPVEWVPENLGQNIQFFGLNGTIIESGRIKSNSAVGYLAGGIFGNPLMNRQLALLAYNNKIFGGLFIGTAPVIQAPVPQNQLTCRIAAETIIDVVNKYSIEEGLGQIHLQWAVQDAPYYDTVSTAGDTALQAVANLAQRCGGVLRWDGYNNYVVAYPDVGFGQWTVPNGLVAAGGIQEEWLLDLGTGRSGTGVVMVPRWAQKNNSQNQLANNATGKGGIPTINQIAKITKLMTADDPDLIYDLPQDFDQVYIQVLVPEGGSLGGVAPVAIESWVTNDPTQWFAFNTATLAGGISSETEFIFYTNIDGRLLPQLKVNSNLFPTGNSSINAGHFIMSLACSRKDLSGAFAQAQDDLNNMQRALMEYNVRNYQFVKTYKATINCMFFGSVPLPGMIGSATVGDMTVSGVIENVTFTYPGFITVEVARYLRLDMQKPPLQWNATGQITGNQQ